MSPASVAIRPGSPAPLGATWDGAGVNFALFSEHATAVELCLFEPRDAGAPGPEKARARLEGPTDGVWHAYLPDARPGLRYGYRVHGPYAPDEGHRFNPAKLLVDPYARALEGDVIWDEALNGYRSDDPEDAAPDSRDSAPHVPRAVVLGGTFDWAGDTPPRTPWHRTAIYELHVKGFTARHPDVPPELRGTYAGLASAPALDYLGRLGVTAVELLPVHHRVSERPLVERGLTNYWGYNSLAYFAPDPRLAAGPEGEATVEEFRAMVRALHRVGIEVILDVVYNHTAEGTDRGPTLSLRGIDNRAYYRLRPERRREYVDFTGCGNTLDTRHPRTLQLILDSLRYWVSEMHVDGFRFDLAAALARDEVAVDLHSAFFAAIRRDPVVSGTKLIAEPWDLGPDGYQVGKFPRGWAEWNGRYRDTVRRYWRGDPGQAAELGYRLTGSSDLYEAGGRGPEASVNFVTAHDGFTLADLVSYEVKRNEANGEDNRDGADDNASWNCGVEGPTADPAVVALRERQARNLLASLVLSQGVPMLCAGDEIGRSQGGNNNAYCHDSEVSWLPWSLAPDASNRLEFVRRLIRLRFLNGAFHRRRFFEGRPLGGGADKDVTWLSPAGKEMTAEEWRDDATRSLGLRLSGEAGEPGDPFLLLLNAHPDQVGFVMPLEPRGRRWVPVLDTRGWEPPTGPPLRPGDTYLLEGRSLVVLRLASDPTRGDGRGGMDARPDPR